MLTMRHNERTKIMPANFILAADVLVETCISMRLMISKVDVWRPAEVGQWCVGIDNELK